MLKNESRENTVSVRRSKKNVREENVTRIILAAEEVFALKGFDGATTQEIADKAGLPKANIHYYFGTKRNLYSAVLTEIFVIWKEAAAAFNSSSSPHVAISSYITAKLNISFDRPMGSKVWANEVIHGAPVINEDLKDHLLNWESKIAAQIGKWVDEGKLRNVNPHYLLNMIWATTQHYADFDHQVRILNGYKPLSQKQKADIIQTVNDIILRGIGLIF